ncbi:MAG TPA: TetR/AcrR family transcriptional regulator [Solirubrobacteraceae bacterium]|jgi:AcrR family transcriptional regulator|nr:TetR/AcrR family transcriptional regulator [Solirubrobacteraceae bacterium]
MAVSNPRSKPPQGDTGQAERYKRLPAGVHGLDPRMVKRDQRERLQSALIELIEEKGFQAVRIVDLARLARVSQPTFYGLYRDKEELFLAVYDRVATRAAGAMLAAYEQPGAGEERLLAAVRAFTELAAAEPQALSLFLLGAFGAGPKVLEHRRRQLEALDARIRASRDRTSEPARSDLTIEFVLGGIREVAAARLRNGHAADLPELAEQLSRWAASYPGQAPAELVDGLGERPRNVPRPPVSERARRAQGRLPRGRSDIPRPLIAKSQRERIVDATAAIVAERGLAKLTIPEIARRANVSNQTFYEMYASKHDAFLGAQKVGMHQALHVTIDAYSAHEDDWPAAVAAGLRGLIDYLSSEPAHAHLSVVDTFAATPEALDIREASLRAFAARLRRGQELSDETPSVAAEAVAGGVWQVLHRYIAEDRIAELGDASSQIAYLALTPFVGPEEAARAASA